MSLVPKKVFFVAGSGYHKTKLASFEQALRDAGIEKYNLVSVSSILPPYCIEVQKEDGLLVMFQRLLQRALEGPAEDGPVASLQFGP